MFQQPLISLIIFIVNIFCDNINQQRCYSMAIQLPCFNQMPANQHIFIQYGNILNIIIIISNNTVICQCTRRNAMNNIVHRLQNPSLIVSIWIMFAGNISIIIIAIFSHGITLTIYHLVSTLEAITATQYICSNTDSLHYITWHRTILLCILYNTLK